MTFQPRARHKGPRWLVLLAVLVLGSTAFAATVTANHFPTSFPNFVQDTAGANDEPGQKDLTAQGSVIVSGTLYSMWQWDDTSWNGNNTGDGCSLFSDDGDQLVDYALCATVGTKNATLQTVTVYSCGNTRPDRCTQPILVIATSTSLCEINNNVTGPFDAVDTQAVCNATASGIPTTAVLLNSCSYPSQQPNSDPSDCVLTVPNTPTSVTTQAASTWSVTLNDTATVSNSATGSVVFKLWSTNTAGVCSDLVWTSPSINLNSSSQATTSGGGTPNNGNTFTNLSSNLGDGVFYWTVDYTPTGTFDASSSACGAANETSTISLPVASP
jgi:hypothetical protein